MNPFRSKNKLNNYHQIDQGRKNWIQVCTELSALLSIFDDYCLLSKKEKNQKESILMSLNISHRTWLIGGQWAEIGITQMTLFDDDYAHDVKQ